MRGWKGEPIGGAGWPPQPALGAAYTDTRRFGAEVPTASSVHKHLLTSSGGRSRLGAETACSMAGWPRAETPRPTARCSVPRPRAPRPGGSTHFRRSSRFRYLTAFQGLNHRAPAPRRLHRFRRLGSTCARVRAPVQKGCVGCARAVQKGCACVYTRVPHIRREPRLGLPWQSGVPFAIQATSLSTCALRRGLRFGRRVRALRLQALRSPDLGLRAPTCEMRVVITTLRSCRGT